MSAVQQDQPQCSIEDTIDSISAEAETSVDPPKIPKLPETVSKTDDYKKYYVPTVVSIGPYHHGKPELHVVEKHKPSFTMKLLGNKDNLRSLYKRLGDPKMVQELRKFYEEDLTTRWTDAEFTKMMLLDSCFILYYIRSLFHDDIEEDADEITMNGRGLLFDMLQSTELFLIHVDLLLLENQIPFKVLREVMNLMNMECFDKNIEKFMEVGTILATERPAPRKWLKLIFWFRLDRCWWEEKKPELIDVKSNPYDHLLDRFHRFHSKTVKETGKVPKPQVHESFNFRNVDELVDVGIHFKPSDTKTLAQIEFSEGCWEFAATVKLPPIKVDDSTRTKLLNLAAYETCSRDNYEWVTSYICLLDSLIDHPEDVKLLRKAWVLQNYLGSDNEVANLFNQIGRDLIPNPIAYKKAKEKIQNHYQSRSNKLFSQLKHEYFKSPWAFFAVLGALIALFLSAVQTYYTIWSPEGRCDDLCMFLKMNHHL